MKISSFVCKKQVVVIINITAVMIVWKSSKCLQITQFFIIFINVAVSNVGKM